MIFRKRKPNTPQVESRRFLRNRLSVAIRRGTRQPVIELLEQRKLFATFTVSNVNDAGLDSLRQAITNANSSPGADTIVFNIPGGGVHTIVASSALPAITGPTTIDGYSQPGASPNSLSVGDNAVITVELAGDLAGASVNGLSFGSSASGSLLRGLAINRFSNYQVVLQSDSTIVSGNFIGTDPLGTSAYNVGAGLLVVSANGVTIGGAGAADRNIISLGSGTFDAMLLNLDTNTTVRNNYIGTSASGMLGLGNYYGVDMSSSTGATIQDNIIASSDQQGIALSNGSTATILGNLIGNSDGLALPNSTGIGIFSNSVATIGDGTAAGRNVISGNLYDGIAIDSGVAGTTIRWNYIGTEPTGENALPNGTGGVPDTSGINLNGGFYGGAIGVTIGGTSVGDGNYISGNFYDGIRITGTNYTSSGNVIEGNTIGLGPNGNILPNRNGIKIEGRATNNTIGGGSAASQNIISGNSAEGIYISSNSILSDAVGWWKADGTTADEVSGNSGTLLGGATYTEGKSGQAFDFDGINDTVRIPNSPIFEPTTLTIETWVKSSSSPGSYRYIVAKGTNDTFASSYALYTGVAGGLSFYIYDGASQIVFSPDAGVGVWDGNWHHIAGTYDGSQVRLFVDGAEVGSGTPTSIAIGYSLPDGNDLYFGSSNNQVGVSPLFPTYFRGSIDEPAVYSRALTATEIATIADIGGAAKGRNVVQGNYLGTDATGTLDFGNGSNGIYVVGSASHLIESNVISGNGTNGIVLSGSETQGVRITRNVIGMKVTGTEGLANAGEGIELDGGAHDNMIGGSTISLANFISGNTFDGIGMFTGSHHNTVQNNFIGTDSTGNSAVANSGNGIVLNDSDHNQILDNVVSGNTFDGVTLFGSAATNNTLAGNKIGVNWAESPLSPIFMASGY